MASPKKRVNPLFVALAVVLVAVVVAVGVVFFQLHSRMSTSVIMFMVFSRFSEKLRFSRKKG